MRQSTYLTMTLVFTIATVTALLCAIICDALNNSNRSITFGCIACACSIPAFSCASILFQSSSKIMKKSEEDEETTADTETVDSEENNNAE